MKTLLCALLGSAFLVGSLSAAEPFDPPSFVKELEDLEDIQTKAANENKAVAFLLMEPGST